MIGHLEMTVNGSPVDCYGNFNINGGFPKREPVLNNAGKVVDYKVTYQAPSFKGEIVKVVGLSMADIALISGATIVGIDGNGVKHMLEEAEYTGDGDLGTEEGRMQFEVTGKSYTEIS